MVGGVVILAPRERVAADRAARDAILARLGPVAGAEALCGAVAEVAACLAALAGQVAAGDIAALPAELRRLQDRAGLLGLDRLAQVAGDLGLCAARGDGTAFAAVWARLVRVAESSLDPADPLG
ncbi:MAG: hypothetical protein RIT14_2770 [Pseudomonadota bacterium]|jgi:hypothetical protein